MTRKKRDRRHDNPGPPIRVGGAAPAVVVPVRMASELLAEVDAAASAANVSRSDWLREAVERALAGVG